MVETAALNIGAVAFIHRFGSSLKEHVHFHMCVADGVFEEVASMADGDAQADADDQASPSTVNTVNTVNTVIFTRPVKSIRPLWPRCKQICAATSCAP